MSKNRNSSKKYKQKKSPRTSQQKKSAPKTSQFENLLLALIYKATSPQSFAMLKNGLPSKSYTADDLSAALKSLTQEGLVYKDPKKNFQLHKNAQLYEGSLTQHPKGFGFVRVTNSPANSVKLQRDPFVSPSHMACAQHGDTVLIRVFRVRDDQRPESYVIQTLAQGTNRTGGVFIIKGREKLVYPDDRRLPFIIKISDDSTLSAKSGDAVIAQFERPAQPSSVLKGHILEVLGSASSIDNQMRLVIEKFQLPHQFSDEVLQESTNLTETFETDSDREDLRETAHITIDGETAKDFDDAVCVIKNRKGFRLFVSIADVSHFVKPGSAIDQEAYARGTSVYFPGRVVPMLPEKLSNNLCSLVPNEDRFTVSAILDFDRSGKLYSKRFTRSIICSQKRFTYTTVAKILIDKDQATRKENKPFLTSLKWAEELANALQKKRRLRGSIDFDLPEAEFNLTDNGEIGSIKKSTRNLAHQMIEEFMLAANEAVAELFSQKEIPAIYRIHEKPEEQKTEDFSNFVKSLGLPISPFKNEPGWFAEVLSQCKESKYKYILNNLLLRSMKQAQYDAHNAGHFGLAANNYTHFTSPIRRYPDLIVHRELLKIILKAGQEKTIDHQTAMASAADFLSNRERQAVNAERDMNDRLKVRYMQNKVGESYQAIISGITENDLYVEIQELCISGSLTVEKLGDDYFIWDKKKYRLFGEMSAKIYQIGDEIAVTVTEVDLISRKIYFDLTSPDSGKEAIPS